MIGSATKLPPEKPDSSQRLGVLFFDPVYHISDECEGPSQAFDRSHALCRTIKCQAPVCGRRLLPLPAMRGRGEGSTSECTSLLFLLDTVRIHNVRTICKHMAT